MTRFPKINFGRLIDQLLEAKEDGIILYKITSENFLPYLDDFGEEVEEAAFTFKRKNIGYFSHYDDPIPTKVEEATSHHSELLRLSRIIKGAQKGSRVSGRQLEEIKYLSKDMVFDAPAPFYKVTPEAKKKCRCMLLKYLIEKGGNGFNLINLFLLELLQKQIDPKAHYYYHMDFLRGFLTELDQEGLVRFESNDFNSLVGTRKYRDTDVEQQTYIVNDIKRAVRGLSDFTVSAKIKDKGEKFFMEDCQQKESFESYLNAKGKKLLPELKKRYASAKPRDISIMVLALEKKKCLVKGTLTNLLPFHTSLRKVFPGIGVYENLRAWIKEKADNPDIVAAVNNLLTKW